MKLPFWLGHMVTGVISILAGMFGVGVVLFSDVFGFGGQLGAVGYILVMYFILSLLVHWLWPGQGWTWFWWLVVPGGLFGLYLAISDFSRFVYPVSVLAGMVLGAWAPKWLLERTSKNQKGVTNGS